MTHYFLTFISCKTFTSTATFCHLEQDFASSKSSLSSFHFCFSKGVWGKRAKDWISLVSPASQPERIYCCLKVLPITQTACLVGGERLSICCCEKDLWDSSNWFTVWGWTLLYSPCHGYGHLSSEQMTFLPWHYAYSWLACPWRVMPSLGINLSILFAMLFTHPPPTVPRHITFFAAFLVKWRLIHVNKEICWY